MPKGIFNRQSDTRHPKGRWAHDWPALLSRESRRGASAYVQALFARLLVANSGAAAAEYTFLVALIAIAATLGMILIGDDLQAYFQGLATSLDGASTPTSDPFGS
jgi:Flp pilus assembly pilin Flp